MTARERITLAGIGWCAFTHQHDNSIAARKAADAALTILTERITARFTPALNTGTALEALILVSDAVRELHAELTEAPEDTK